MVAAREAQTLGLHSLLFLAQALGEQDVTGSLEIEVISNNVHVVTGEEVSFPEKSTVLGACKVIPLEYLNVRCRNIDIVVPNPVLRPKETCRATVRRIPGAIV